LYIFYERINKLGYYVEAEYIPTRAHSTPVRWSNDLEYTGAAQL